ncbi:MAG: hypothetical protein AAGE84_05460 [Cyanobacteria bacterium P01_G01_bin.39]
MATVNYNFPLDPNGHSESELVTALYLYEVSKDNLALYFRFFVYISTYFLSCGKENRTSFKRLFYVA